MKTSSQSQPSLSLSRARLLHRIKVLPIRTERLRLRKIEYQVRLLGDATTGTSDSMPETVVLGGGR